MHIQFASWSSHLSSIRLSLLFYNNNHISGITWNAAGWAAVSRYDVAGNLTSSTDELNRTTRYTYDALNRMVQQALPDGAATKFVYDAAGNLLQRQMPGALSWIATYDSASRKLT
jgi:YD repeat-containing protein